MQSKHLRIAQISLQMNFTWISSLKQRKAEIRPLLAVFALFLTVACQEQEQPVTPAPTLLGTFAIKRYTDENGILHAAWPGEYADFTADSVQFFAVTPVYDPFLNQSMGYERNDRGGYALVYRQNSVRFAGHTFRIMQTDSTVWLMGQCSIELKPSHDTQWVFVNRSQCTSGGHPRH